MGDGSYRWEDLRAVDSDCCGPPAVGSLLGVAQLRVGCFFPLRPLLSCVVLGI